VIVVLVFAAVLLLAVLVSALAKRSVLSTAVVFLAAGFLCGPALFDLIPVDARGGLVARFAELALFSILFTDAMHLSVGRLREVWRLPGRALLIGLPVTMVLIAVIAHTVAGVGWLDAWLIGAALSPTDPVFAAALIGEARVPRRLRELLNVESGLNDGLALPLVIGLLSVNGSASASFGAAVGDAALGAAIGVAVAWSAVRLNRTRAFGVSKEYAPIGAFAVGLLVLSVTSLVHANEFLAAFAAGVTLASTAARAQESFRPLGEPLSEILKLAALLLFGALMSPALLRTLDARDYLFATLVLVAARPLAIFLSLRGSGMTARETVAAGWFGPKGFASVFFGFLIVNSGIPGAERIFHLVALAIAMSIVAHSSSDVFIARWFGVEGRSHARSVGDEADSVGAS
jgi:NhaP-type Na+/H+ or K+/H+ antiporter